MLINTFNNETGRQWVAFIKNLQQEICSALQQADGKATFNEDVWQRAEENGGGGISKIIQQGTVFEKGGVNISAVSGYVTDSMKKFLQIDSAKWFAAGISIVLHPQNPFVPTIHCNYRMFELYNENDSLANRWFGGGTDLTPYYLFEEDAQHFHETYKTVCDKFDPSFYPEMKSTCDDYFVNTHRGNERRGIGGIFYDHKKAIQEKDVTCWMNFGKACGESFLPAYLPIVEKRKTTVYTDRHKHWQEIRRGRYVEFNLVHDRGTLFGLKTNGRIESILMSLPPTVRFEYDYHPTRGTEEDKLLQVCLQPKEWLSERGNLKKENQHHHKS